VYQETPQPDISQIQGDKIESLSLVEVSIHANLIQQYF